MTLIMYSVKWIRESRAPVRVTRDRRRLIARDPLPVRLRAEERFQVAYALSVQSTAHSEDDLPVRVPRDPEHLSFPNDFAGIAANVRRSPECMAIPTPPLTD